MGLLGLNFGISKGKSESTTNLKKTENIFQQQSTDTTGTTNTATNSQQDSTGHSVSSQTGGSTSDVSKISTGAGTTSLFGEPVLGGLQDAVLSMLNQTKGASPIDLAGLSSFNRDSYVKDAVGAAEAEMKTSSDAALGGVADMVGSKVDNSSMATLLADRVHSNAAKAIGGVRAQAEATANQILGDNIKTAAGVKGQEQGFMTELLAALKGGTTTTQTAANEGTKGTTATTATGTTDTSESTKMASSSLQTIQQLVNALLTGTTTTDATETSKGKTSGMTAGANISIGK